LFKLKHDQEDLGDEHVLRTVISSVEENGDNAWVQSVIFHVCAEKGPDGESDSDILEAMEEGRRGEVVTCCGGGGVLYLDAVG
jgi:hypothetical protein